MDIGDDDEIIIVEPLEDPVPQREDTPDVEPVPAVPEPDRELTPAGVTLADEQPENA